MFSPASLSPSEGDNATVQFFLSVILCFKMLRLPLQLRLPANAVARSAMHRMERNRWRRLHVRPPLPRPRPPPSLFLGLSLPLSLIFFSFSGNDPTCSVATTALRLRLSQRSVR